MKQPTLEELRSLIRQIDEKLVVDPKCRSAARWVKEASGPRQATTRGSCNNREAEMISRKMAWRDL
ncbi:MAG: hypothetical protein U1C55_07125, partial [Smithellaceae bacterium]|nr:hypothetical protein [Smithellaceae bacterium]